MTVHGVTDGQLAFDLPGMVAPQAPSLPRLLSPAEVAVRCGLAHAPSAEQAGVVEVPVDLTHRATGGDWRSQLHRAGQARDVARALIARRALPLRGLLPVR